MHEFGRGRGRRPRVTDIAHQHLYEVIREASYADPFPAESFVQVAALADPEWLIEIEIEAIGAVR